MALCYDSFPSAMQILSERRRYAINNLEVDIMVGDHRADRASTEEC